MINYTNSFNINNANRQQRSFSNKLSPELERFINEECLGIKTSFASECIFHGQELFKSILNLKLDSFEWKNLLKNYANHLGAIQIIWFLYSIVISQGDAYTHGAMRIQDEKDSTLGSKLESFLRACGDSYQRISTHMNENLMKGEFAYGLDIGKNYLPAKKRAILFFKQPDGSFYLKLEAHGFPGFNSLVNSQESLGHAVDYLSSKINNLFRKQKEFRRESCPQEIKKKFIQCMDMIFPSEQPLFLKHIFSLVLTNNNTSEEDLSIAGTKYGITLMRDIIANAELKLQKIKLPAQKKIEKAILEFNQEIHPYLKRAKQRNYFGDFKGNEVLLAVHSRWFDRNPAS